MKSLGFIEIQSVTAALEAIDVMCKTADVKLVSWERKLGGRLVTVIIQGDVASVNEAVEAAAAHPLLSPIVKAVIPNPHEEIMKIVNMSASRLKS